MKEIELRPHYTSLEIPGRCVRCLAKDEYERCLRELLREEETSELREKFELLISFLSSPHLMEIVRETEKLLGEGKEVRVRIYADGGEVKSEIKTS